MNIHLNSKIRKHCALSQQYIKNTVKDKHSEQIVVFRILPWGTQEAHKQAHWLQITMNNSKFSSLLLT